MKSRYIIFLLFSTGFTALLNFIVQIYIARNSSEYVFGIYSVYNTILLMGVPLITMGLSDLILKQLAEENNTNSKLDINFLILISVNSFLGFLLLWGVFTWYFYDLSLEKKPIIFMAFGVFSYVLHELCLSFLIGNEKKKFIVVWQPALHSIRIFILILLVVIYQKLDVIDIIIMSSISSFVVLLIITFYFKKIFTINLNEISFFRLLYIYKNGFWFGLSGIFYIIYSQISSLYVGKFYGVEEAGYFNIGYTFLLMSLIVPNTIYAKILLPKLHKAALHNPLFLKKIYRRGALILFLSGFFVAIFLYSVSEYILLYLYGSSYLIANDIFRKIIINIPLFYLVIHYGIFSYLNGLQKYKALVLALTTIFSLVANYFLVLHFGLDGAAFGIGLVLILLIILYSCLNNKLVFRNIC